MTTTLIVLAHPNRSSFNGTWAEASAAACKALGHKVLWSDLVEMGFDAVERAELYNGNGNCSDFDPLKAQEAGAKNGDIPDHVINEVDKLRKADQIIFHFPLWWFAPPAVLKGWFDRVLLHGDMHTVEERFDTGRCRDKTALFCVTTGATEAECGPSGKEGNVQLLLWPAAYTLRYLGIKILDPVVVSGVHGYHVGADRTELEQRLAGVLNDQADLIAEFERRSAIQFNMDQDFDSDGRLKSGSQSHNPFILPLN